jgi:dUTP pyrophosphatase
MVSIGIRLLNDDARMPKQATSESAGADLCSTETLTLYPNEIRLVHTGLQMDIPKGYHIEVRSRSGLAVKRGVFVLNSPGTVDSDYTGEIGVILCNAGKEPWHIIVGDRIAQMVVIHHEVPSFTIVKKIQKDTERGSGGFGHTGV